jgi:hypothetical protein
MSPSNLSAPILEVVSKRIRPDMVQKRVEAHVATDVGGETVAVDAPQRVHAGIAVLVTNLAILVSGAAVEAGVTLLASHFVSFPPRLDPDGGHSWRERATLISQDNLAFIDSQDYNNRRRLS